MKERERENIFRHVLFIRWNHHYYVHTKNIIDNNIRKYSNIKKTNNNDR